MTDPRVARRLATSGLEVAIPSGFGIGFNRRFNLWVRLSPKGEGRGEGNSASESPTSSKWFMERPGAFSPSHHREDGKPRQSLTLIETLNRTTGLPLPKGEGRGEGGTAGPNDQSFLVTC